jgi:hypothetical protein
MQMTQWFASNFDNFKRPPDRKCEIFSAPSDFEGCQNGTRNFRFSLKNHTEEW